MIEFNVLAISLSAWIGFGTIHTLFASNTVKSIFPMNSQLYRIIYNITNTLSFLVVVYLSPSLLPVLIKTINLSLGELIPIVIIIGTGAAITAWGLSAWDLEGFLGLEEDNSDLQTSGPYQLSRHPVYSGIIVMLIGLLFIELSTATLLWFIGMGGYFILGTFPEENKLLSHFGAAYREYQSNVGRLFPTSIQQIRRLMRSL